MLNYDLNINLKCSLEHQTDNQDEKLFLRHDKGNISKCVCDTLSSSCVFVKSNFLYIQTKKNQSYHGWLSLSYNISYFPLTKTLFSDSYASNSDGA